jgi:phospho-2-dehydro-3-deoxyheptonate aldolase
VAPLASLAYGQSITDACVDLPTTERLLERLARACGASSRNAEVHAAPS